jgi:hypothetical protein
LICASLASALIQKSLKKISGILCRHAGGGRHPGSLLSALEEQALGGSAAVPFLLDVEVHIRFLVVVPLLIVAEFVVHQRMRLVVRQFLERNLTPESALQHYDVLKR